MAASEPAANSSESPGRNGVTTRPVSQNTIRNRIRKASHRTGQPIPQMLVEMEKKRDCSRQEIHAGILVELKWRISGRENRCRRELLAPALCFQSAQLHHNSASRERRDLIAAAPQSRLGSRVANASNSTSQWIDHGMPRHRPAPSRLPRNSRTAYQRTKTGVGACRHRW
jgi:hypothetical protein